MRPDDVKGALDALAADEPEPDTTATTIITRGRRRIVQHRIALVGVAAALIAVVATAGAVAHSRDTSAVTSVPATSTTLGGRAVPPPTPVTTPANTTESQLRAPSPIASATPNEAWICGNPMTYSTAGFDQFQPGTTSFSIPTVAKRADAAATQQPVCTAVAGGDAWLIRSSRVSHQPEVVRIRSGGADIKVFPFGYVRYPQIESVDFIDADNGWALVERTDAIKRDLYRTQDGGATWSLVLRDAPIVGQIDFSSSTRGWARPDKGSPKIATTSDGGLTWQQVAVPTKQYRPKYTSVSPALVNGNVIVLNGETSTGMLVTPFFDVSTDGGRTWTLRSGPKHAELSGTLAHAFSAADAEHWALGSANWLYFTDDGGQTWRVVAQFSGLDELWYVDRASTNNVVVSGIGDPSNGSTVVLASEDAGETWSTVNFSAPPLPANAKVMNFPGGIIGCPAHPLTPVPAGNPPPGLEAAAFDYIRTLRRWEPTGVDHIYRVGANPQGSFGYLFAYQVTSCGQASVDDSWVVEAHGASGSGGGGSTPRVQLALAHSADGWHVFGSYH